MKKYEVQINGRNFLIPFSDDIPVEGIAQVAVTRTDRSVRIEHHKCGFYTSVFVEAESPQDAENKAVDVLRKDSKLRKLTMNEENDVPRLYAEAITERKTFRGCHLPRTGFGFYLERQSKK